MCYWSWLAGEQPRREWLTNMSSQPLLPSRYVKFCSIIQHCVWKSAKKLSLCHTFLRNRHTFEYIGRQCLPQLMLQCQVAGKVLTVAVHSPKIAFPLCDLRHIKDVWHPKPASPPSVLNTYRTEMSALSSVWSQSFHFEHFFSGRNLQFPPRLWSVLAPACPAPPAVSALQFWCLGERM